MVFSYRSGGTHLIPALWRQRKVDFLSSRPALLVYVENSRTARATW